jgi:tRNA threonylcarbamoyl adenosine modification protein YeaZ
MTTEWATPGPADGPADGPVLVIDTATTRVVVALAGRDGEIRATASWDAGYRHGETLLPSVERLLGDAGVERSELQGIVVGTGPGAFTGLRVGIATAKGLAHGLGRPLVGVSTAEALLRAAGSLAPIPGPLARGAAVLLLPAGPSDRIVVRAGVTPVLARGGDDPELATGEWLVAVDLADRAPADAVARGEAVRERLADELAAMGVPRLPDGSAASMAALVPDYVTLPRGTLAEHGEVEWSRDPR